MRYLAYLQPQPPPQPDFAAATSANWVTGAAACFVVAGCLQARHVLLPQRILAAAQLIQVIPAEDAGVVPVREGRLDRVIADLLDIGDADFAFAQLQHFLARAVALHFSRWRIHTQIFAAIESNFLQTVQVNIPAT